MSRIQNEDVKSESELIALGADKTKLIHDSKIYVTANSINKTLDDAIIDGDIGAGGGGEASFIDNFDFETDLTGWATYADAAAAVPIDGTGGTPNSTIVRTTTAGEVLAGVASMKLTLNAGSSRQGEGFSVNFIIEPKQQGKLCKVEFDYKVLGGLLSDDDLRVFVYDITNARLIYLTSDSVKGATAGTFGKFINSFQASSDSVSYRLIVHVARSAAFANTTTVSFDDFVVSEYEQVVGGQETDWIEYPLVITASTTNPTIPNGPYVKKAWYKRRGDSIQIRMALYINGTTGGNNGSGQYRVLLPSGLTIGNLVPDITVPCGVLRFGATTQRDGWVATPTFGVNYLTLWYESAGTDAIPVDNTHLLMTTSNSILSFTTDPIPVAGWSSNTVYSGEGSNRLISARLERTTALNFTTGTWQTMVFNAVSYDTIGGYSSGVYTIKQSGKYRFKFQTGRGATPTTEGFLYVRVYKNTTQIGITSNELIYDYETESVDCEEDCVVGDEIRFQYYTNTAWDVRVGSSQTIATITRLPDSVPLASRERVVAEYYASSAQTFTAAGQIKNYGTKVEDTHNAVTTGASWRFTSPQNRRYQINISEYCTDNTFGVRFFKNGIALDVAYYKSSATAISNGLSGSISVQLNQGEYIDVRSFTGATWTSDKTTSTTDTPASLGRYGTISIVSIGD